MVEVICLWCEARLAVEAMNEHVEQTCPECLTTWRLEDDPVSDLPMAA